MKLKEQLTYLITSLDNHDKPAILSHLKQLDTNDRYMRFFAVVGDTILEKYVNDIIDFRHQKGFGIFAEDRKTLIAFAHLSGYDTSDSKVKAELGISVDKKFRDKGLAKRLMDRILVHCRAHDIGTLFMSCLSQNNKMQRIAKNAGLRVIIGAEEAIAELKLAEFPMEKAASISHEIAYEQIAIVDKCYRRNTELINALLKGL